MFDHRLQSDSSCKTLKTNNAHRSFPYGEQEVITHYFWPRKQKNKKNYQRKKKREKEEQEETKKKKTVFGHIACRVTPHVKA